MLRSPSLLVLATALLSLATAAPADILVKSGDKIAFLGDSITQQGWSNPIGYVKLVMAGLSANGINAEPIPAGISGHKSDQMLARLQKDVLDKKPAWMTLSCGVNNVWHGKNGVPLDEAQAKAEGFADQPASAARGTYTRNITELISKTQAAGVKPVVLTATVIKEDLASPENAKLAPYNDFLRKLAAERKLPLADLNALFQERLKKDGRPRQNVLTVDGVHMNPEGNKLMATGILTAFGLNEAQLRKANEAWAKIPPPTPKPVASPKPASATPAPAAAK